MTFGERIGPGRERAFAVFRQLVETFVPEEALRPDILARARTVARRLAVEAGQNFNDFRYRSTCRLNILQKPAKA